MLCENMYDIYHLKNPQLLKVRKWTGKNIAKFIMST